MENGFLYHKLSLLSSIKLMDRGYIFSNTLVYGIMAICLSGFFAYGKVFNLGLGWYFIAFAYALHDMIIRGFSLRSVVVLLAIIALYAAINRLLLTIFRNDKQRHHVWLVITLGAWILLENAMNLVYSPNSVSINMIEFSAPLIVGVCVFFFVLFFYLFRSTILGMIFKWLFERAASIRSLGIPAHALLQRLFLFLLALLAVGVFVTLSESAVRSSDGIFYLLKWIGIMILVWVQHKEYMFFGALAYVLIE